MLSFLLATAGLACLAQGQTRERITVPYPFTVASTQLPPGTYTFVIGDRSIVIQSDTTSDQAQGMFITRLSGPNPFLQAGTLVFDNTDGGHVLSEIWIPRGDGILMYAVPKGHTRALLSFSEIGLSGHVSGKTAYELTCARCHGDEGQGTEKADKYFGIKIPRLNSPEVRGKSDTELRTIIAVGTKTMPPVEVDEAGFLHRLPAENVDGVIAYLRTLKP
jgi:cytochrome c5